MNCRRYDTRDLLEDKMNMSECIREDRTRHTWDALQTRPEGYDPSA